MGRKIFYHISDDIEGYNLPVIIKSDGTFLTTSEIRHLRKSIDNYEAYIDANAINDSEILESNSIIIDNYSKSINEPNIAAKDEFDLGYVYFIRNNINGFIKIGYTKNDPNIRLGQICRNYIDIHLLGVIHILYAKKLESELHNKYKLHNRYGEWFDITEMDVKHEINKYNG